MIKKFDELTWEDQSTPRYQRARRFANEVFSIMRDFIPTDRETRRRIDEMLFKTAYEANAQIISVPPECDELDKMALEKRMLEAAMKPFILPNQPQPLERADTDKPTAAGS